VRDEFQVPFYEGCQIVDAARQRLDGLSKRFRFIMSHPTGKIEILGWAEGGIYAKYLQTNQESLHNKIFHAPMTKDASWLEMEPEIGRLPIKTRKRNGRPLSADRRPENTTIPLQEIEL